MCKINKKTGNKRIDPCMGKCIETLNSLCLNSHMKVVACCCGHNKYPRTIIMESKTGLVWELLSGIIINRKKRFYRKDKNGFYYIPELIRE